MWAAKDISLESEISQLKEQIKKEEIRKQENKIGNSYCGNPITSEHDCQVLAKKNNNCEGCKFRIFETVNPPKRQTKNQKTYDFVVKHKVAIYQNTRHYNNYTEGKNDKDLQELIEFARKEIGYSDRTWSGDIFTSLVNLYKKICV
jgi:hypothetical protein